MKGDWGLSLTIPRSGLMTKWCGTFEVYIVGVETSVIGTIVTIVLDST